MTELDWNGLDFEARLDQLLANLPIQDPLTEALWVQRAAQRLAASVTAHGRPAGRADRLAVRRAIAQADLWLHGPRSEVSR